jgi:hypothetical protein
MDRLKKQLCRTAKGADTVFVVMKKESGKTAKRGMKGKTLRSQVENIWAETMKRRVKLFKITRSAIMEM